MTIEFKSFTNEVLNYISVEQTLSSIIPILSINKPILFLRRNGNNIYLVYTLEDRVLYKKGKKSTILEVLISKTDYDSVKKLMLSQESLHTILNKSEETFRVGKIGKTVFPKKEVRIFDEIADRIPEQGVNLCGLPNSINLNYQLRRLENEEKYFKNIFFTDSGKTYENISFDKKTSNFYKEAVNKIKFFTEKEVLIVGTK